MGKLTIFQQKEYSVAQKLQPSRKGFTLVEVLIAVAILATGITVVMQSLSYSARIASIATDTTRAVFLAEDQLQKIEFYENLRQLGSIPASFNDKLGKFEFKYTLTPSTALSGASVLDYNISWLSRARTDNIDIKTYIKQ